MREQNHVDAVRAFFQNTDVYLAQDYQPAVRRVLVRNLIGELDRATLLDIGCGDGRVSLQYLSPTNRVVLMDISENMLAKARATVPGALAHNVETRVASITDSNPSEKFDVIICLGLLAHVPSVEEVVHKVADLLKPTGRCVFQITDADSLVGKMLLAYGNTRKRFRAETGYQLTRTGTKKLESSCKSSGLTPVASVRYWPVIPGMKMLPSHVLERYQLGTSRAGLFSRFGAEALSVWSKGQG